MWTLGYAGPCRWPHNNELTGGRFRTLFVSPVHEEPEVRRLISEALHASAEWQVASDRRRPVAASEHELAAHLLALPRRTPAPPEA
ncbi:MAG: hypothetical protein QM736_02710 [Vicinamibacterales bacterium]